MCSASSPIHERIFTAILFRSIRKKRVPKKEPWGTPALVDFQADTAQGSTVNYVILTIE